MLFKYTKQFTYNLLTQTVSTYDLSVLRNQPRWGLGDHLEYWGWDPSQIMCKKSALLFLWPQILSLIVTFPVDWTFYPEKKI